MTNVEDAKEFKYKAGVHDRITIVKSFLETTGLVKEHIASFNQFLDNGIKDIVKANSKVISENHPSFYLKFKDVKIGYPEVMNNGILRQTSPHECRLRNMTYSATMMVDIEYTCRGNITVRNDVNIGKIPIMLRSNHCHLHDKSEEEIIQMKECPLDPGGYFIVKGTEKVILIHEQMSKNRMIVEHDKKHRISCSVTSSTVERKTKTHISIVKDFQLVLCHNSFLEDIPICVAFKCMGVQDDKSIFELVGGSQASEEVVGCCIEVVHRLKVFSQEDALEYVSSRLSRSIFLHSVDTPAAKQKKIEHVRDLFRDTILCHVPVENWDFRNKVIYMALMAKRVIQCKDTGKTDMDFLGNKRFELEGQLLSLLFEDTFKTFVSRLIKEVDSPRTKINQFDVYAHFGKSEITQAFERTITSGKWDIPRFHMNRHGVTQTLTRLNYLSTLAHMTKIQSQFERNRKVGGVRSIHPSQYMFMCPFDTPEGDQCGLVKNFALLSHFTTEAPSQPVVDVLMRLGVDPLELMHFETINGPFIYRVFVNGTVVGITDTPFKLCEILRYLRRMRHIDRNVSIGMSFHDRSVLVSTDAGRICRPFIIVDSSRPKLMEKHVRQIKSKEIDFNQLVDDGIIEYLDPTELNDRLVAVNEAAITDEHTHLEIESYTMFGICAGIIPYSNHTQAPRLTYQSAMGKQAMGIVGYNAAERIDKVRYNLWYPQRPLVSTDQAEILHFNELPSGQNFIVAIMSYSGYDIEDAIIINKASLERGLGRISVHKSYWSEIKNDHDRRDTLRGPKVDEVTGEKIPQHAILGSDGLAAVGSRVYEHQVLINKATERYGQNGAASTVEETPERYDGKEPAIVDKVLVTMNDNGIVIKVDTRQMRSAEVGDKFSSRYGQKGVLGAVVPQVDMPFSFDGIVPDIIMNPHGFPSRMTVGKLFECLGAKKYAVSGKKTDGTAFMYNPQEEMEDVLEGCGYSRSGKEPFINGITGEVIEGTIFNGPIFYQRLRHMVQDKIHARSSGNVTALTRQPMEGRSKDGGLRLGEMERDCLLAYGATSLIQERFVTSSDGTVVDVCRQCGLIGYEGWCTRCSSGQHMCKVGMPYASKLLLQEIMTMGIAPRLEVSE